MTSRKFHPGFTIVELLIVIVVIGILAAVALVSFTGISGRANISMLQSNLTQMGKAIEIHKIQNNESYPVTLATGNVKTPDTGTYIYQGSSSAFCLSATNNGTTYRITHTDKKPAEGTCSGVLASGSACPTGYIVVPGNTTYGTSDFCAMKYEAKNVSGVATSQATGVPWVSLNRASTLAAATAACSGCHLMTEGEWMTIAANVLSVPSNWSGGSVGSGFIYQGHVNNNPGSGIAASSDDTDGLVGMTGGLGGVGMNNRRTLTLTNGEVIWDFSGNVYETTNATMASGQQPGVSGDSAFTWRQWNNGSMIWNGLPALSRANSLASQPGLSAINTWTSANGIGQIYSYYAINTAYIYSRGGYYNDTSSRGGVLALYLNADSSSVTSATGFRAVK